MGLGMTAKVTLRRLRPWYAASATSRSSPIRQRSRAVEGALRHMPSGDCNQVRQRPARRRLPAMQRLRETHRWTGRPGDARRQPRTPRALSGVGCIMALPLS